MEGHSIRSALNNMKHCKKSKTLERFLLRASPLLICQIKCKETVLLLFCPLCYKGCLVELGCCVFFDKKTNYGEHRR